MKTIIANTGEKIRIGKQGETGVCRILFPYLDATSIVLLHRRRGDAHPYSGTVERETIDGTAYAVWEILSVDTAVAGVGEVEVSYYKGETIAKTVTYPTVVDKSVEDGEITVPTASATWVQNVADKTAKAEAAKTAATTSAAAAAAEADSLKAHPYDYAAELQREFIPADSATFHKVDYLYAWPTSAIDPQTGEKVRTVHVSSGVKSFYFPVEAGQVYRVRKPAAPSVTSASGSKVNVNRFSVGTTATVPESGAVCLNGIANIETSEITIGIPDGAHYLLVYYYFPVKVDEVTILDADEVYDSITVWRETIGKRSSTEFYGWYPDSQCYSAFIAKMNDVARRIGMKNSYFYSASGLTRRSITTPADLARLALACAASPAVMDWCGTTEITASIYGINAREYKNKYGDNEENICIYKDDDPRRQGAPMIAAGYTPMCGKGGSIAWWVSNDRSRWGLPYNSNLDHESKVYYKNFIYFLDVSGRTAAVIVCLTEKGAKTAAGKWLHPMYDTYATRTASEAACLLEYRIGGRDAPPDMPHAQAVVDSGGGYVAFIVPTDAAAYKSNFRLNQMFERLPIVSDGENIITMPASTSKLLTALVAAEYQEYFHRRLILHHSDIQAGSGGTFKTGDEFRFDDAVRIMLMKSSNTLAKMIAREVGLSILHGKNQPVEYALDDPEQDGIGEDGEEGDD